MNSVLLHELTYLICITGSRTRGHVNRRLRAGPLPLQTVTRMIAQHGFFHELLYRRITRNGSAL